MVRFDSLRLLLFFVAAKGLDPEYLDVKTGYLYGELNVKIDRRLREGYRYGNQVAPLKRYIYGLKQSSIEWYSRLTVHR
jgi:hypothetical protein